MEHEAGRELDAKIAVLLGWTEVTPRRNADGSWSGVRHDWPQPVVDDIPRYSTDIGAAWAVVGKMRENGYYVELRGWVQVADFMACFRMPGGRERCCITDDDAPLAICRAALAAMAEGAGDV
jgi:hypothetical protein